jgi:hypothetical protein
MKEKYLVKEFELLCDRKTYIDYINDYNLWGGEFKTESEKIIEKRQERLKELGI